MTFTEANTIELMILDSVTREWMTRPAGVHEPAPGWVGSGDTDIIPLTGIISLPRTFPGN